MKHGGFLRCFLFLLGLCIMAFAVVLSLCSLDAPARLLGRATAAEHRCDQWAQAVAEGDYAAIGDTLYGQPELDSGRESGYAVGEVLWDAFRSSLSCEFAGECYATQSGVARDVTVTALDISAVMAPLKQRFDGMLRQRAEDAEDPDTVYDANNDYREDFVMSTLCDAVQSVLAEGDYLVSRTLTLNLVYEDGQWWILPEQDMINLLSGKVGKGG